MTSPAVLCPSCGTLVAPGVTVCPSCGLIVARAAIGAPPSQVGVLGIVVAIVMGVVGVSHLGLAATWLAGLDDSAGLGGYAGLPAFLIGLPAFFVSTPLFIVWFYLIRRNAGRWGPQRRSQGWAIGGWLLPPVFLWFPFQIAMDAWRASRPADQKRDALVVGWWLCWLGAWFTGFYNRTVTVQGPNGTFYTTTQVGISLGSNVVSGLLAGAAALLGAGMVIVLSQWQQRRIQEELAPQPA